MSTVEKKLVIGNVLQAYKDFLAFFPLKVIRTPEEYNVMVQHANGLVDLGAHVEGHELHDLYVIATELIYGWDKQSEPPVATPRELLKYLMDAHKLKQKDLSDCMHPSVVSDFLSGRRNLSKASAIKLAARFCVSVDAFLE
jgi:HTH-type transcriptional regulator/antitoxin HigA